METGRSGPEKGVETLVTIGVREVGNLVVLEDMERRGWTWEKVKSQDLVMVWMGDEREGGVKIVSCFFLGKSGW